MLYIEMDIKNNNKYYARAPVDFIYFYYRMRKDARADTKNARELTIKPLYDMKK